MSISAWTGKFESVKQKANETGDWGLNDLNFIYNVLYKKLEKENITKCEQI